MNNTIYTLKDYGKIDINLKKIFGIGKKAIHDFKIINKKFKEEGLK